MNVAILLAGGCGTRMKCDIPKQLIKVNDKPLMCYALAALFSCSLIDGVQIVLPKEFRNYMLPSIMALEGARKLLGFTEPGSCRQHSIFNALSDISGLMTENEIVLIQDGARPLTSLETIISCIEAMEGFDGVLPVLPMKDTVYLSTKGQAIDGLMNRDEIYAGQAPEAFRFGKYFEANSILQASNRIHEVKGSTEAAILGGLNVRLIPGDEQNFKITTREDLTRFISIVGF